MSFSCGSIWMSFRETIDKCLANFVCAAKSPGNIFGGLSLYFDGARAQQSWKHFPVKGVKYLCLGVDAEKVWETNRRICLMKVIDSDTITSTVIADYNCKDSWSLIFERFFSRKSMIVQDPKPAKEQPPAPSGLDVVIVLDVDDALVIKRSAGRTRRNIISAWCL